MFNLRSWATPITVGSFIISMVTGVVLFFHWNLGLAKPAHEWLSWFMLLGVIMHLIINWRAFKNYFSKRIPLVVMAVFVIVTVLSLLPLTGSKEGGNPRAAMFKLMHTVEAAPLSTLATLAKTTPEALMTRLQEQGVSVDSADQTLDEVAAENGKQVSSLIPVILP
ncbi:MAG: DUF4405 domain-containing protein [Thiolinea sp.]